jgi:HSP20 family protein
LNGLSALVALTCIKDEAQPIKTSRTSLLVLFDVDQGGTRRLGNARTLIVEVNMVERSHTAGWLPQGYAQAYQPLNRLSEKAAGWFAPKADAGMSHDAYEITLELPGVTSEGIELLVQDGAVTVQGEKHVGREQGGWTYFFSERELGAFQRSFRLPPDAAPDGIDAILKNGILTVRIPKLQAAARDSRRVAIRAE